MQFSIIRTISEMDALAEEWNSLLSESASHVPFLRHEYMSAWWQNLGGGEWQQAELSIIVARGPDGQLVGIAPLFLAENQQGDPALMFLGTHEISDYLDVIARPEDLPVFLEGMLEFLCSQQAPQWRLLDWYNLLESSPTLPALQPLSTKLGLSLNQDMLSHCPCIPLPGDWEAYMASIDKKQRHEIRRKMRRALENSIPVRWYILEDEAKLDSEIDAFFTLMTFDAEKARFLTPLMREQMRSIIQIAFRHRWLQLAFIEVDGEKAAAYLNFDYDQRIWVYNSGFNPRFGELSVGWVLLGYLIQWANEHKRAAFDFMRGDEDYKYRFGAVDRRIVRVQIKR